MRGEKQCYSDAMDHDSADISYFTIDQLEIEPEDHVLEIGFGSGTGIMEACRLTPRGFVAGIDESEEMLKLAQQYCARELMEERAELAVGNAAELPYADASFDKIFGVNVAHIELREILRVLKPGGRIALFHQGEPVQWEAILRDAGFTNVRSETSKLGETTAFCVIAGRED